MRLIQQVSHFSVTLYCLTFCCIHILLQIIMQPGIHKLTQCHPAISELAGTSVQSGPTTLRTISKLQHCVTRCDGLCTAEAAGIKTIKTEDLWEESLRG